MRILWEILYHMYILSDFRTKTTSEYQGIVSFRNLQGAFRGCCDFQTRQIDFGLEKNRRITVCWIDGLVSGTAVTEEILRPLTQVSRAGEQEGSLAAIEQILRGSVYRYAVKARSKLQDVIEDLTHGSCALLFEESGAALCFEVRSDKTRAIGEPTLEKSLKGAKDAFVETLRINTALVRQRLCTPQLKLVEHSCGSLTHTKVAVLYMEGIAAPELVERICERLVHLDAETLLGSSILEERLADAPFSPFPQMLHTERPDRFAMHLLDGRVGLLVDGLPVGLLLPADFAAFMSVTDDAGVHFSAATALTLLRYAALLLSLLTPAVYVAVAGFHPEMIPTRLLLSIIEAEQDVPFSPALEVLGMLFAFALLQEAGLRLPNPVGDTVSIIGALIVGQAAVEAKLVSPISIIVVAISGISCYALPSQDMASAFRLCRLALLVGGILAGLYGVCLGCCLLFLHLADLDSCGYNYTAPLSEGSHGLSRLLLRRPRTRRRDPIPRIFSGRWTQ